MSIVPGRSVDLPDGRVVRTVESGALDGTPLLVFHPTPSSRLFVRQYAAAALRTGTRLVGFSRPGYGGSTMATPGLRVVAEDAVRVADAAGLDRFAVLGFSGGTPFAAATAALCPERVTAAGLCAAVAPWQDVAERGVEFDEELEGLLAVADRDLPAAVDGIRARAEREYAGQLALDDTSLAERLHADTGPPDSELLTPTLAMGQAVTLRDAFGQDEQGDPVSYDGLAFDELAFGREWDADVRDILAPTWIWQGSRDVVTPLDHAHWYAARVSNSRLVVREGRGHLGSFEAYAEDMLATLREAG
ncbi:alpha/beta fold hydrolase [Marmoricola sp. URHA0025 HA25]